MKKIMQHLQAAFMFLIVYFTVLFTTKSEWAALSVTAGMGAFSAIMYLPNRRTRRFMERKGMAFTGLIIPDFTGKSVQEIEKFIEDTKKGFTPKTPDEIEKMTTALEVIEYKKQEHDFNTALLKAEYAVELKKAMDSMEAGTVPKAEFEALKAKQDLFVKELERIGLAYKAMTEKPGAADQKKTEFVQFIERESLKKQLESQKIGMESFVIKAPALMTTANVIPNVAGGFNSLFGNYIDNEIYEKPKPENFILDLVDVQTAPGTENIWYTERINEEGDAEFIAEGALKPLADAEWIQRKADIKEVAVRWKMSNRLIMHAPSVVSNFREHVEELIDQKIDDGALSGDNVGNNMNGIINVASPFIVPAELANFYQEPNIWDVIIATATYVRLNNFKGQLTAVLNTVWQAKMMGYKNTYNDYIIPPFVTKDGKQVGEVRVVFSNKMPADAILLGDLKKFKIRIAEDVRYYEGWENDDFSKNLSSRKLEAFLGSYFPNNMAGAIVYDEIDTILTAIAEA